MRAFDFDFLIDGMPILAPDCDIALEVTDLDDADSGRDESGYMHRVVLRSGMKNISLVYKILTKKEYRYMEALFTGKPEFRVDYRGADGQPAYFTGYRSKHGITIHNAKAGIYKNYKFSIIEC